MTTAYYRQHHELDAPEVDGRTFRPFWRRRSRIDTLVADHAITPIVWRAAVAYRTLVDLGEASTPGPRLDAGEHGAGPPGGIVVDRVDARHRLVWVRRRIGSFATRLVNAVIVDDLPWSELGRRMNVDPKTARVWAITALQLLPAVMFASRR